MVSACCNHNVLQLKMRSGSRGGKVALTKFMSDADAYSRKMNHRIISYRHAAAHTRSTACKRTCPFTEQRVCGLELSIQDAHGFCPQGFGGDSSKNLWSSLQHLPCTDRVGYPVSVLMRISHFYDCHELTLSHQLSYLDTS